MAYDIRKVDVWVGDMADRPAALAEKLEAVAAAGAHLECVIARRAWNHPKRSVVFLAPLRGAAQARAARAVGLEKALGMNSLRVEGPDRPGLVAKLTRAVGDA
ncbi:MAG: amino acid-binding protein, partial [Phycisphaerae bacterium]